MSGVPIDHGEHVGPVVRLTRFSAAAYTSDHKQGALSDRMRWTVYGVDASGVEHIYAEHESEDEHMAWCATDPLWREAQAGLIRRLLENPGTRDLPLQVNIKAAIDDGDLDTAARLVEHLSASARHRLHEPRPDDQGTDNHGKT